MTKIELQSQIQRKVQGLPADVLQELYDYLEAILEKRKQQSELKDGLQEWWNGIADFSDDYLTQRIQPPLDKSENLFE
ncbi:DUF2281 domain-containing protein [Dyadobacter jiangsuensis]|uniref:DUF2281 domain-containing protein n=1 Tax=Dyadobacter fermentans TaxID=94254 RepID=UPI001CBD2E69|nr:DUF2281 domain-containing protein [Dyadobacter fermentans]MBZ1358707.1 DUF2281 domain-containing protein [Dyadobacter fermentans]